MTKSKKRNWKPIFLNKKNDGQKGKPKIKRERNKKKIAITLTIIVGLSIAFVSFGYIYFFGSLYDDDGESDITWNAKKGDVFYFKVSDSYYNTIDDDLRKEFSSYLRSEIMEVKDLSADDDFDDDLLIMSSWMFGDEDIYTIEFPNYFDLYNLFILLQNNYLLENMDSNLDNVTELTQWATPSAVHLQCSSLYHYLNDLINSYNSGDLNVSVTDFPDIDDFFSWIIFQMIYDDDFLEDFEDDTIGQLPENLSYSLDSGNALIIATDPKDSGNHILNLTQDSVIATDSMIYTDIFDYISSNNADLELKKYWHKTDRFFFDFQLSDINDMEQEVYMKYKTDDFDMTASVYGEAKNFTGFNGLNLRIINGTIQYKVGDYIYDGCQVRESFTAEKGWNDLSPLFNLSNYFGDEGSFLIKEHRINLHATFNENNPYLFDLKVKRPENSDSVLIEWDDIPLYYQAPYDFKQNECFDNINEEYNFFKMNNFTNIDFQFSKDLATGLISSLDDVEVKGVLYYYSDSYENIIQDFFFSQLYLFSIYHTLFFPSEFSSDSMIAMCEIMNDIAEMLFGVYDFFMYETSTDVLEIEISYESTRALRGFFQDFFLEKFNIRLNGFIEGEIDIKFNLLFDERIGCMNESYITLKYVDLGYYRKIGMELNAVCDKDGVAKFGQFYDSQPDINIDLDETVAEIQNTIIYRTGIFIGIGTMGATVGVIEIIRYVRKKKRENR